MNTSNSLQQSAVSSPSNPIGVGMGGLLAWVATLAKSALATGVSAFQPRAETAAESMERLRILADAYEATQPSFAADLRAVMACTESRERV